MAFFPLFSDHHLSVLVTVPLTKSNCAAERRELGWLHAGMGAQQCPRQRGARRREWLQGTQIEHT